VPPPNSALSANSRLASRIEQALRATSYLPLRNLQICAAEGTAILRGAVPSYYMKQIAQAAVRASRESATSITSWRSSRRLGDVSGESAEIA